MAQQFKLPDGRIVEATPDGKYRVVSGGPQPITGGNPMLPGQIQGQGLNNTGQSLQNAHTAQQIEAQPLQNENTAVNIQQGRASVQNQQFNQKGDLRDKFNALPDVKNFTDAMQAMAGAMKAPDSAQGDLAVVYSFAKAMDPGSVVREGEMEMANQTASIVQRIQQQYGMIGNGKRLPPDVRLGLVEAMRQKNQAMVPLYEQQRQRYSELAKSGGFDPEEVVGKPVYQAYRPIEEQYVKDHGGTPRINGQQIVDYSDMQGGPQVEAAQGLTRNEIDPKVSAGIDRLVKMGRPLAEINAYGKSQGFPGDITPDALEQWRRYLAAHPNFRGSTATANRVVPMSLGERVSGSGFGAGVSGAAKAATAGFADEAAGAINALSGGDYTQGRDEFAAKQALLADAHPVADLAGQAAGGVSAGIGLSAGLGKINALKGGMFGSNVAPQLLSREAMSGDALYGTTYGAGSNNENRLSGAAQGLGLGLAGGIGARGAVGVGASLISPTGGKMAPLYEMGVRPSIGQRMGGVANTIEEKLQSIPLVGDAIKGTRDRARDQFQIGLFNDSLGEIGRKLPQGTEVGHAPHAYAQDAFNHAYDTARLGMTVAPDAPFISDVANLQKTVGALRPESQKIFDKLWSGSVERRAATGAMNGDAYKSAVSELGKKSSAIRSNPTGDAELADALDAASEALKQSAMRNSPPQAVAAMNAADKGYAKLVRLEEASRKPGGEPAEFSPTQYNNAVKTASGGVRNRAYLRGDALNADIAGLGTRLGDKVSNSGTVDRLLAGMAVGGAGYVEPVSATALGALGAINAPGLRNITTGLMAPRNNPMFDVVADKLRQRARLAGMFGAPLALDRYSQ